MLPPWGASVSMLRSENLSETEGWLMHGHVLRSSDHAVHALRVPLGRHLDLDTVLLLPGGRLPDLAAVLRPGWRCSWREPLASSSAHCLARAERSRWVFPLALHCALWLTLVNPHSLAPTVPRQAPAPGLLRCALPGLC